jgi:hypothetical protein
MNKKQKATGFVLCLVLQAVSLFAGGGQEQKSEQSFGVTDVSVIDLVCEQGIVTFTAIDGGEFTFDEEYRSTKSAEAEVRDGVFRVRIDRSRFSGRFNQERITWSWYYGVTIGVPRSFTGDIKIRFGDGVLRFGTDFETSGTITVTMDGADFSAQSLTAKNISIDAPYGDITVLGVSGAFTATAKRGDITVGGIHYSSRVTIDG